MERKDNAPALELPNGMMPDYYNTKIMHAPNPNRPGPTNEAAKKAPSLERAMKGIDRD